MCARTLRNNTKYYQRMCICAVWLIVLISACRKQDIEPDPVGEPVPYTGPAKSLETTLFQTSNTLFIAAWKRADMTGRLHKLDSRTFTLFVPTDDAMKAAGWTLGKINTTLPDTLNALLAYYIADRNVAPASLATIKGNIALASLRTSADVPEYSIASPYTYLLFTGIHKDSLWMNGYPVSKWGNAIESTSGTLYTINRMLPLPQMDMLAYLQSDERFSFYLEACRINDSLYIEKNPWYNTQQTLTLLNPNPKYGGQYTLFAPTNEAFKKSGLQSIEDIRALACRTLPIGDAHNDEESYYVDPLTSLDSILLPHKMNFQGESGPYNPSGKPAHPAFFYNDLLDNTAISGMMLRLGQVGSSRPLMFNLEFTSKNGQVYVRRQGAKVAPMPLVQHDIQVLNGVIHVLNDGLLVP
ncbi:fasciclin domain-containing protein [Chitinophaga pendula]|uniref:fasciclin domain-containing protein n=1 Tax=Chitinophaga TaxID=79328 RepID=UPI0012FD9239|nr:MULTISPECIES: fasciclin domain-containing protein [Chitinophaga]UCJ08217.1 fasciclin domain-containing protein [Chitinophaga pendula]